MPHWHLLNVKLSAFALVSLVWSPLVYVVLALVLDNVAASSAQRGRSAARISFGSADLKIKGSFRPRPITKVRHPIRPLALLIDLLRHRPTPCRSHREWTLPQPCEQTFWWDQWTDACSPRDAVKPAVGAFKAPVLNGGNYCVCGSTLRGGLVGGVRMRMTVEMRCPGRHRLHFGVWPVALAGRIVGHLAPVVPVPAAVVDEAMLAIGVLGLVALDAAGGAPWECDPAWAAVATTVGRCKADWTNV